MSLLRPKRERPFPPKPVPPESRIFRGTQQPRKKAGQFALMARGPVHPVLRTWTPDNWRERHPRLHALGAAVFFVGVGFALIVLAWRLWE